MIEKKTGQKRFDFLMFGIVLGLVILFLIPLLAGWEKMFFDDIALLFYPQQVFLSRCLGKGTIPLWDPHICAGATPFYSRLFQSSLYPFNWPFLYLGHISPARDYFWLVRAPLTLHYLLSTFFAFLFARWGLRLNRLGSFILSSAYSLSPTMIYMSTYPPEVFIQAWLPLFCLLLILFFRTGRWGWLVLGALAFTLASPAGDVPFVFHVVLITGLFGVGWMVLALIRRDWKTVGRVVIGGVAIFGIGFLLAGIYWANMIEGLKMLVEGTTEDVERLSSLQQSMHPLYLITLFIPDFFGGITSHHTWGAAFHIHCSLNDANLLGGMASILLILLGFCALRKRGSEEPVGQPRRGIWWVFFGLFVFGIFTVLGAYTPVYRVLRWLVPILKMPYPIRFRSIECFALAGLLGTSASILWERREKKRFKFVVVYLGVIALFIILALLWPYQARNVRFSPGWRHLTALGDWPWFRQGPLLYVVLMGIFLVLGVKYMSNRIFVTLLVILVIGECLFFAYGAFYRNRILNRRDTDISAVRYSCPAEHPIYRLVKSLPPQTISPHTPYRWLYYRSYFDNLAWINGSLSILGFDVKPLLKRFQEVLEEEAEGFPYELRPKKWNSWFWPNMSVGYALSAGSLPLPNLRPLRRRGSVTAYELTNALPRFYFQDRWAVAEDEKQLLALQDYDLRATGYCEKKMWDRRPFPEQLTDAEPLSEGEWIQHFSLLQDENKIISRDLSNPNRIVLEVDVAKPCLLVMTDVWHPDWKVIVDGEGETVYRVNYLQRGIWCHPGSYRIIMEFLPSSLKNGIGMTAMGLMALTVLFVVALESRKKNKSCLREGGG